MIDKNTNKVTLATHTLVNSIMQHFQVVNFLKFKIYTVLVHFNSQNVIRKANRRLTDTDSILLQSKPKRTSYQERNIPQNTSSAPELQIHVCNFNRYHLEWLAETPSCIRFGSWANNNKKVRYYKTDICIHSVYSWFFRQ